MLGKVAFWNLRFIRGLNIRVDKSSAVMLICTAGAFKGL